MIVGFPNPIRTPLCVYKERRYVSFPNHSLVICVFPKVYVACIMYVKANVYLCIWGRNRS